MNHPTSSSFVLRNGRVVDGTGRSAFAADVVVDGATLALAEPGSVVARPVIDLDGLVVSPGFIDTHAHADLQAHLWGDDPVIQASRLRQGITTEVVGNCGFSAFPIPDERRDVAAAVVETVMGHGAPSFPDFDAYAAAVDASGPATNVAPLVGQGALRAGTLGYEARAATPQELDTMQARLRSAMAAGAFGLSTGLVYAPATYTPPEEVAALVGVLAQTGGIYASHVRNETDGISGAIVEAIEAGRPVGVPVHISHLKVAGKPNWGRSAEILDLLERERAAGADVTADVYPYTRGSTTLFSTLPPWVAEGGIGALLARVADPAVRARAHRDMVEGLPGWQNLGTAAGWDRVWVAFAARRPEWVGASIADLAAPDDTSTVDTIARVLLANDAEVKIVLEVMDEADVRRFLGWKHSMIGSDGLPLPGKPHPRVTGTFPRVLGRYRDVVGPLEVAVHRMTGAPADRFAIPGRGRLGDGMVADLVVFDPDAINDRSTYDDPWLEPSGMHHVVMGGRVALWDGEVVDASAGSVLRRSRR